MSEKYDVIVIGAGIGGLTAAAILARNGKKVLVLEKNPVPGGYAVNFKRGEFEFDASLHLLNGFDKGRVSYNLLEKCGIDQKVKFVKPQYLFRTIFPDFDIRVPQCNPEEYIAILSKFFPSEKDKLKELFDLMYKIFCRFKGIDIGNDKISFTNLIDYKNKTYHEVTESFLLNKRLTAVISQVWPYMGLPLQQIPFFVFLSSWVDYIYNGGYYPRGGGQAISNALVEAIRENGGEVIFKKEAQHILIKDNRAYGVMVNDGNIFLGEKVISNIDARTTFYNLVGKEHLAFSFLDDIDRMQPSISAFQVYLGLNINLINFGITDYTIFVNPNYDIEQQFKASLENNFNDAPIEISFYSLLEKDAVTREKNTMSIIALSGYDFWKNLAKDDYKKKKKEMAEVLINKAKRIIPNLSSYIEKVEIATPLTMERYTGNYKGAIYGWSQSMSQYGGKRMAQKTPIENLFLTGAWTRPSGGIAGVMQSGVIVSRMILI